MLSYKYLKTIYFENFVKVFTKNYYVSLSFSFLLESLSVVLIFDLNIKVYNFNPERKREYFFLYYF